MAIISISEFPSIGRINYGATAVDCLIAATAAQDVTIPTGATVTPSVASNAATNFVRVFANGDCQIAFDTAGAVFERFPAGTIEVRKITPGQTVSVKAF